MILGASALTPVSTRRNLMFPSFPAVPRSSEEPPSVLMHLLCGFAVDCKRYSLRAAAVRLARASRIFTMPQVHRALQANPAFAAHVGTAGRNDPVFFLSHRHFLAQGFTPAQRARAALFHYEHEARAFRAPYIDAVYRQGGLSLWEQFAEGQRYDMRLMPGNDVINEGGLSLVLHVNGGRLCVVSFSTVPADLFFPAAAAGSPQPVLFVTRKQLTETRDYQKAFNKTFDRTTPAHLCFGALAGLALVQGQRYFIGTKSEAQPSFEEYMLDRFKAAYDDFWDSLAGREASAHGYAIDLPLKMTPLDELEPSKRKRALARRAHIDRVRESAMATIRPLLLHPPAAEKAPAGASG